MKNHFTILTGLLLLAVVSATAQDENAAELVIQQGNELYKQKQYDKAEAAYRDALLKDKGNTTASFNLANALYLQSKPDEAIKILEDLVMNTSNDELKARAHYNKGAILSAQKKLEQSVEAYKSALRNNPADKNARENLQKALIELRKKTPPPPPKENKKNQQQQQPQKMDQKEAEQRLKLLEQKEKEVQQRLQQEKSKNGGGQAKDW